MAAVAPVAVAVAVVPMEDGDSGSIKSNIDTKTKPGSSSRKRAALTAVVIDDDTVDVSADADADAGEPKRTIKKKKKDEADDIDFVAAEQREANKPMGKQKAPQKFDEFIKDIPQRIRYAPHLPKDLREKFQAFLEKDAGKGLKPDTLRTIDRNTKKGARALIWLKLQKDLILKVCEALYESWVFIDDSKPDEWQKGWDRVPFSSTHSQKYRKSTQIYEDSTKDEDMNRREICIPPSAVDIRALYSLFVTDNALYGEWTIGNFPFEKVQRLCAAGLLDYVRYSPELEEQRLERMAILDDLKNPLYRISQAKKDKEEKQARDASVKRSERIPKKMQDLLSAPGAGAGLMNGTEGFKYRFDPVSVSSRILDCFKEISPAKVKEYTDAKYCGLVKLATDVKAYLEGHELLADAPKRGALATLKASLVRQKVIAPRNSIQIIADEYLTDCVDKAWHSVIPFRRFVLDAVAKLKKRRKRFPKNLKERDILFEAGLRLAFMWYRLSELVPFLPEVKIEIAGVEFTKWTWKTWQRSGIKQYNIGLLRGFDETEKIEVNLIRYTDETVKQYLSDEVTCSFETWDKEDAETRSALTAASARAEASMNKLIS